MPNVVLESARAVAPAPRPPAPPGLCYRPDPAHTGRLLRTEAGPANAADLTAAAMHGAFCSFVLDPQYPCVGARSAVQSGSYHLGIYQSLTSDAASTALARHLAAFIRDIDEIGGAFATFVAMFQGPRTSDEIGFERDLWAQLQALHDRDTAPWDPKVSAEPGDPRFSFSFAGAAFFVIGMHPGSPRLSRKFPWPTLIFNPHAQFERLRQAGKYARMQSVVRTRDHSLQGDINPNLDDFGTTSAARQYSGRVAPPDWRPPFHAHGERRS